MKRKIAMFSDHTALLANIGREDVIRVPQMIGHLAELGYQLDVFTREDSKAYPQIYEWMENVRVIQVPEECLVPSAQELPGTAQDVTKYMIEFFDGQEKPYDLIHADFWEFGWIAAEIKSALGTPFVIRFHAPAGAGSEQQDSFSEASLEIEGRIMREADGIIVESAQDRDELVSRYHADPIHIIQMQDVLDSPVVFYENILAVRRVAVVDNAIGLLAESEYHRQFTLLEHAFEAGIKVLQATRERLGVRILEAANSMINCLDEGGRMIICGEASAAAEARNFRAVLAQHFSSLERTDIPILSLSDGSAAPVTWLSRTVDENIVSGQVEMLGRPGDLLIGITRSEGSAVLKNAFRSARRNGLRSLSLSGGGGGELIDLADVALVIPSSDPQQVREIQGVILHLLCELVEEHLQRSQPIPAGDLSDVLYNLNRMKILAE